MRHRAGGFAIVLLGLAVAAALMWRGSALPRPWLSVLEGSGYWLLLGAALLAAFLAVESAPAPTDGRAGWGAAGLAATLVLFSLPVAYLWSSGRTTFPAVGGFLPFSDAGDYYFGALHLLNDRSLDEFSTRRPLNAAFLAVRLGLLGGGLRAALAVQAWLTAAAAFLAASAIARRHGLGGGLLTLGLLYECARPYLGTTFSECLGLTFGCLGFAACWTAAGQARGGRMALAGGAALLALGLQARAGAYLVLPALVLWAAFAFRPRPAWRPAAWAGGGACLGLLLNASMYWRFAHEDGIANANLAEVVYGLVAGGRPWTLAREEHPECWAASSERVRALCVYARALERLRAEPAQAVRGYLAGVGWYGGHLFGFIDETASVLWRPEAAKDRRTVPLLMVLTVVGLVVVLRSRGDPRMSQLLAAAVGILGSAPVLASSGSRVLAATLPYTFALPAIGLAALGRLASLPSERPGGPAPACGARSWTPAHGALALGAVLAAACAAAPLVAALRGRPRFDPPRCPPGLEPVIFEPGRDAVILHVLPEGPGALTQAPRVAYADWRADPSFGGSPVGRTWRKVRPGDRVVRSYDYTPWRRGPERHFLMIVPAALELPAARFLLACSQLEHQREIGLLWHPEEIRAVDPSRGR